MFCAAQNVTRGHSQAQGRRAAYYEDRETCQVVQQISPHELVVRIYKLYWSYVKGKDTTRKSAYEVMRIFVCGDDGKKATIEPTIIVETMIV